MEARVGGPGLLSTTPTEVRGQNSSRRQFREEGKKVGKKVGWEKKEVIRNSGRKVTKASGR